MTNAIRSPTACATAFSRASWSASSEVSVATHLDLVGHLPAPQEHSQGDGDGATADADVHDAQRWRPGRARRADEAPHDLQLRQLDELLRLRAWDQRARVDAERQPVELLHPADIGDGLAGRAPVEGRLEARSRPVADRRIRVRDDAGPVGVEGEGEQQLGVQAGDF